ncbi:hypothetical protein CXB49_03615 [Chromobacterium sp. ATCC 53434]|uniref:hypothetical protein n=1 Tax=Chromobacterium TaxID=535 RepID=UPI000C77AE5D|nr:hypothetical protein [Chromobacterium sp. ATCC 53434]AUH49983.1 hypothetical protein CXB49_03615 [Chromobacterium sp. ATCC 53434]
MQTVSPFPSRRQPGKAKPSRRGWRRALGIVIFCAGCLLWLSNGLDAPSPQTGGHSGSIVK